MEAYTQPTNDERLSKLEDRLAKELERKRRAEQDLQKRKEHLHRIECNIRKMQAKRKELIGEKIQILVLLQRREDGGIQCASEPDQQGALPAGDSRGGRGVRAE